MPTCPPAVTPGFPMPSRGLRVFNGHYLFLFTMKKKKTKKESVVNRVSVCKKMFTMKYDHVL